MRHLPAHPKIVRYKDVFEDKEAVYLVMELCQGGELFDRIVARGHYTERGAATITKTIIEVVQVIFLSFFPFSPSQIWTHKHTLNLGFASRKQSLSLLR